MFMSCVIMREKKMGVCVCVYVVVCNEDVVRPFKKKWKPAVMFTAGNTDAEIEDSLKDKIGRVTTSIAVRED